uniref:Integrase, catalytic region, zinc finger, CCHC-type, peptidase aspartic, catalytic n=1 Tax=Tanacetum cinerariifolium TaxID=118510 RepID=A0A699GMW2_TANCI|nr:hypothetical protein [Tanacetum cinerariifolium]
MDTQFTSDTLDPLSQKLDDENMSLEFLVMSLEKENEHLKAIYQNLFDFIKQTWAQTKIKTDSLQEKLNDTIYEKAKLRAKLFGKFSEQKYTVKGTSVNTKFAKPSILGKPPSQPFKHKFVSDSSEGNNACTSNPQEPTIKRFPNLIFSWQVVQICLWARCYPKNDCEDIGKLGVEGDIGFFIGYSATSYAYGVTTEGERTMYDDYIGGESSVPPRTAPTALAPQVLQTPKTSTTIADTALTSTN